MQSQTKQTLKIYWQHARKYKLRVFFIILLLTISVAGETATPYFYKQFINILSSYDITQYDKIIYLLLLILGARIVRSYSFRLKDFITTYFQARVMADLNNTCFNYLHQNSYSFFSGNFVGSLVNKVKKYERGFEVVADRIIEDFFRAFLAITFSVTVLAFRNIYLSIALITWCVIYFTVIYFFSIYKLKFDLKKSELDTKLTGVLADTITNNLNIKLFSNFDKEEKNFRKINEEHFKIRYFSWNLMTYLEVIQGTLMIGVEIIMMYLAVKYWKMGQLTVGDFTLIQLYLIGIFDKLWNMGKHVKAFYEALADADEMTEILTTPHEVLDAPSASRLKVNNGQIEFKEVNFGYGTSTGVFNKFSLKIKAGERIALIGPSGGGKSTIVKLLLRFTDIHSGEINLDGHNIAQVTQDSLRENIALVPQDPILFHRTLMSNIRYGKLNATDEEVINAAKLANAHEFILRQPEGYNTFVGERGIKLSGGERQRIAIARAILKNARILILDEATSSLDSESEQLIQDALKNLMNGKTVIVIAHRLSTIMQMDRIIVLEKGKISEEGKHDELLKAQKGTYQKLWQIQAGGFA